VLRLNHLLGGYDTGEPAATVPVVVYTEADRSVALAVERILDIVEHNLTDHTSRDFGDDGLLGSTVIQHRVTELLDVRRAILAADPLFHHHDSQPHHQPPQPPPPPPQPQPQPQDSYQHYQETTR